MKDVIDPIHLILEYQKGQRLGDMVAPRANRYILVHDPLNARLAGLEPLRDYLRLHTNVQQYAYKCASLNSNPDPYLESNEKPCQPSSLWEVHPVVVTVGR